MLLINRLTNGDASFGEQVSGTLIGQSISPPCYFYAPEVDGMIDNFFIANGLKWQYPCKKRDPVVNSEKIWLETAYSYFSPNVVIASSAAFLWLMQIKVPDFFVKPFAFLSSMTFPLYFMHLLIISIFKDGILGFSITPYSIHPVVGILGLSVVTFFVSMSIAVLIRFIPYSSRVIG